MLKKKNFFYALLASQIALQSVHAERLPKILSESDNSDDSFLPDFSYAGYDFGSSPIPTLNTVVKVADYGAVPDDGKDDSKALKAAIAYAHSQKGPVRIQMAAGRYILSEILWIEKSNIVFAGMGSGEGGTQLYMPRPLDQVDDNGALKEIREYLVELDKRERQKDANIDVIFSEYSWSGGFIWTRVPGGRHATYLERYDPKIKKLADISGGQRGAMSLIVPDAARLSKGDVLQIHWHNRSGPEGALVKTLYGDSDIEIGDRHWTMPDRPLVRQATRIESIVGDRVTIADPLLHNISEALPAYFASWDHLKNVGLQDFAMKFPENPYFGHHVEAGYNGVYLTGVHNGWIKNIHVTNADSGILTDDIANVTIANIVTDGDHPAHYSVHVGNVHNVLIDDLTVFNPTQHTLSFNTQATKSVYKDAVVWQTPTLDQHAGANHQNLYDNVTVHLTPDKTAKDGTPIYDLYAAGGAGYWKPGHGRYNTTWNLNVVVEGGVSPDDEIVIYGGSEGPDARVIGMHGNRKIKLDFQPAPYVEELNQPLITVPSLYDYQLSNRPK